MVKETQEQLWKKVDDKLWETIESGDGQDHNSFMDWMKLNFVLIRIENYPPYIDDGTDQFFNWK